MLDEELEAIADLEALRADILAASDFIAGGTSTLSDARLAPSIADIAEGGAAGASSAASAEFAEAARRRELAEAMHRLDRAEASSWGCCVQLKDAKAEAARLAHELGKAGAHITELETQLRLAEVAIAASRAEAVRARDQAAATAQAGGFLLSRVVVLEQKMASVQSQLAEVGRGSAGAAQEASPAKAARQARAPRPAASPAPPPSAKVRPAGG